jgi:hypothetical protein
MRNFDQASQSGPINVQHPQFATTIVEGLKYISDRYAMSLDTTNIPLAYRENIQPGVFMRNFDQASNPDR